MRQTKQKVKLQQSDWDALFPGRDYLIGSTTFRIYPLSLSSLAFIARKIGTITDKLTNAKVSVDAFNPTSAVQSEEGVATVVSFVQVLLDEAPEVLAEMSGLESDDVSGLPLTEAVKLFNECLDVNITSQESLVKNLRELGEKFRTFAQGAEAPTTRTTPAH